MLPVPHPLRKRLAPLLLLLPRLLVVLHPHHLPLAVLLPRLLPPVARHLLLPLPVVRRRLRRLLPLLAVLLLLRHPPKPPVLPLPLRHPPKRRVLLLPLRHPPKHPALPVPLLRLKRLARRLLHLLPKRPRLERKYLSTTSPLVFICLLRTDIGDSAAAAAAPAAKGAAVAGT